MTLFEALEPRLLLAASVTTDKMDYAPGATALVNGSGFIPGEAVRLQVRLIDGTPALGSNPWQVADGNNSFTDPYLDGSFIWHYPDLDGQVDGNIQTTWYVDPADETNATMQLTATGLSSGEVAQTTFTDSASITNVGTASDTNSNSNSLTVTLPSAIAVGNTVIVTVALKTTDAGTVSVTDAAGDSYHIDANITNSSGVRLVVLSAPVTTALSAGSTITVRTPTNISDKAVQVSKANAAFEAATTSTGSDGYPTSSAVTASVSNASYLILGVNAALTSGSESSYSINYPFYKVGSAASQPGNPSNTIVWTASQGVIGQPGSLYPSGSFPQYNIIGQLNTAGPWAGAILSYKEVSTTTSTITYPVNGGTYGSGTWSGTIRGSASSANTVTQVRLSIRDTTAGKYWNGTSWNGIAATRLAASGTTSWTYASFPAASLTQGHSYTVTSYATDNQGYTQVPGTTSTFSYPDTTPPTVSSVIVTPPPASYFLKAADVLTITVNFSEAVTVTGTPRLALNTTPTAYATYASGTGTTVLKFSYTVVAGQNSPRLAYTSTAALTLNGGTIRDAAGNNAILTLVAPGSGMDNLYYQNFVIDTTVPVVSSVSVSPSPTGTAPTISAALTDVNPAATSRIAAGEYFVDVLGAPGTGTSLSLSPAGSSTCTGSALVSGFAGLGGGAHTIYVRAKDSAGNWSAAANTSFVKDSAMPAVTVTAPVSPANQDPIPFTVTFTQNVTGLSTAGFAVTNGTVVGLSGSGTTYTVLVDPAGSGAVTCQVLANAAENAIVPGKFNTPSNVASVTCDGVAPALSSLSLQYQSAGAYMKAGSSVTFGLTFSEVVSITGTPQLRLNTGATVNYSSGSGTTTLYFGTYVVAAGQNAAPLDFASDRALVGTIKDAAGNAVVSPTPGPSSLLYVKNITVDTAAPTPVVSTPGTATNTSPITFAINFSEVLKSTPVLTNSNLTVTGGTLGTLSNNGTSYAVPVTPTGQGPVTLLVKASAVQDRAGNASTVSNTASVIYDSVAPTIGASATKADATAYAAGTWTNQNVTVHFIASDVTSGVASVTADTTVNTEGVTASLSGTATDRAGNSVGATFGPIWIDKMAPDTSIDSGPSNPTNSESASFAFSGTDATSGIAGFEYKLDSGSWTAGSSPLALSSLTDGSHTLQIRATDHAGNTDATPASQTWVVDTVAPDTVSTSLVGSSLTNASSVLFVVTFSENVTGVAPSDFTISTTGTLAGTSVTVVSGSDRVYTVTVDTGTGKGTLRLDVKASATIRDTAGNPLASAFNTGPAYTIDKSGSNGVVGTDGNDTFRIRPAPASYSPGTVLVYWLTTVGRRRVESLVRVFSPNERIMVSGGKGNDTLEVVGDIIRPVFLYGGSGNDVLKGGGGDDVLVGGDGQDVLTGGWGRDILIGGASADRLYGGIPNRSTNADDQNILIGDATVYDNNDLALLAMQQAWSNRLQPIETRVSALREGTGSLDVRLTSTTVLDDTAVDQIFNSTGRNWFWNVAKRDKLIGWRKDIDFIA